MMATQTVCKSMGNKRKRDHHTLPKAKQKDRGQDGRRRQMTTTMDLLIAAFAAVATALFVAGGMIYGNRPVVGIWLYFSATVLSVAGVCVFWQQKVIHRIDNPPYSIGVEAGILGISRDSAIFGFICGEKLICPVSVALNLRITNLQSVQADIVDLRIEVEGENPCGSFRRLG
jgi:hypothetical protein